LTDLTLRGDDMVEIAESNLHDIDDLVEKWKAGWRELAKFGNQICPTKLEGSADRSSPPVTRILFAFQDALSFVHGIGKSVGIPVFFPDSDKILDLAASDSRHPYKPKVVKPTFLGVITTGGATWRESEGKQKQVLQKTTNAFATSATCEEALYKIATKSNVKRFLEFWSQQEANVCRWAGGEYLNYRIHPRLKKIMEWLEYGLRSKQACDKAWWNCFWIYVEPDVEMMLSIRKRIETRNPLLSEQLQRLGHYMAFGHPRLEMVRENEEGAHRIHVMLELSLKKQQELSSPFSLMALSLLVQPAFVLAQRLQDFYKKAPRYLRQCRAPSCGKWFYTQDKRKILCQSLVDGISTNCRNEWTQFRRYLKALNKDPEKEWDNSKRKDEFLSRER